MCNVFSWWEFGLAWEVSPRQLHLASNYRGRRLGFLDGNARLKHWVFTQVQYLVIDPYITRQQWNNNYGFYFGHNLTEMHDGTQLHVSAIRKEKQHPRIPYILMKSLLNCVRNVINIVSNSTHQIWHRKQYPTIDNSQIIYTGPNYVEPQLQKLQFLLAISSL